MNKSLIAFRPRPFEPVQLEQHVYEEIKRGILEGVLRGDIVQRELSEELGVSRTPIRMAFARLIDEGLIKRVYRSQMKTRYTFEVVEINRRICDEV